MSRANYSKPSGASRRSESGANSERSKRRNEQHRKYGSRSIGATDIPRVEPFVIPIKIENVIECQRNKLVAVITLLHCLHSVLRRQLESTYATESFAVQAAIDIAKLPVVTEFLMENVRSVHDALDSASLRRALAGPL
jgi:hypothetical protein